MTIVWNTVKARVHRDRAIPSITRFEVSVRLGDDRITVVTMQPTADVRDLMLYRHVLNSMVEEVDTAINERSNP